MFRISKNKYFLESKNIQKYFNLGLFFQLSKFALFIVEIIKLCD
jgi:hypothetical protein